MDGAAQMGQAFSDEKPRILVGGLASLSGRDRQNGFRLLVMGTVQGIRDPDPYVQFKALGIEEGMEELAFASMLMRQLDNAEVLDS